MTVATPQLASGRVAEERRRLGVALTAVRPRQWIKNLLLFAGILFAAKLSDGGRWLDAFTAFSAYCLVASGAYLLNDVRDAEEDRLHPVKRLRPVAAGELSPRSALALALVLVVTGISLAASLGTTSLALLLAFVALQVAYTTKLKRTAFLDVAVIATFFVIRAAAGAAAVHVPISPWLLACTACLALFLGLGKRRGELVLARAGDTVGRAALRAYSLPVLDRMLWVTAGATIAAYTVYGLLGPEATEMVLTVPFVAAGIARYLHLIHRHDLGEAPEYVLLSDRLLLTSVALWVIATSVVIGGG